MMKLKFLLITLLLSSLSVSLFANTLVDSAGVENQDGKKIILHKVAPKETYYAIGRRYNIAPKIIMTYNNNVPLVPGQVVKVPTDLPFAQPVAASHVQAQPANTGDAGSIIQYKVAQHEYLYGIAKRFNTTVDDIKKLNSLQSTTLTPGQVIQVRQGASVTQTAVVQSSAPTLQQPVPQQPAPVQQQQQPPAPVAKRDSTIVASNDSADSLNRHIPANRYGLLEKNEKGVGVWEDSDTNLDASKKWVLHRTAPIGTVIKITNPMTNRTTFAKVIGRINENEMTKDAIIMMTKSVAESLGALDKRFHVIISYGTPNE
jgi:LysM repeat protein